MKKTLTVNLNNTVYHIDEDAFLKLQEYLDSLKLHFEGEDGADEILGDIEARIAELFKERMRYGLQVVSIREVDDVIAIMGHPEDFADDLSGEPVTPPEFKPEENKKNEPEPAAEPAVKPRRKLYRDEDDAFVGGVASGLGYYFGVSTLLMRILFIVLSFFWGGAIWIYLILWILVPKAKTAAQKLEMRGEPVTIDNIKRFVMEAIGRDEQDAEKRADSFWYRLGEFFLTIIKGILKFVFMIFGGCLGAILLFILAIFCFVMLALVKGSFSIATHGMYIDPNVFQIFHALPYPGVFAGVGLVLLGIPVYALFRLILGRLFHWEPQSQALTGVLIAVWVISFIACMVLGIMAWPALSALYM